MKNPNIRFPLSLILSMPLFCLGMMGVVQTTDTHGGSSIWFFGGMIYLAIMWSWFLIKTANLND